MTIKALKHGTDENSAVKIVKDFLNTLSKLGETSLEKINVSGDNPVLFIFKTMTKGKLGTPLRGGVLVDEENVHLTQAFFSPSGGDTTVDVQQVRGALVEQFVKLFAPVPLPAEE
ncbi:MAG: hypothetical protein Q8P77_02415 [Candidatus Veblenbacteria bacterium]|nr:hypothetical protein [Candidatus Veblenbacteria bacterium]